MLPSYPPKLHDSNVLKLKLCHFVWSWSWHFLPGAGNSHQRGWRWEFVGDVAAFSSATTASCPTCMKAETHEIGSCPWEITRVVPQKRVATLQLTAFGSRAEQGLLDSILKQLMWHCDASGDHSCQPWRRWESSSAVEFESHFVLFISCNRYCNPSTAWSECDLSVIDDDWCAVEELVIDVDMGIANESGACVWDSALCLGEMLIKEQCLCSTKVIPTSRQVVTKSPCNYRECISPFPWYIVTSPVLSWFMSPFGLQKYVPILVGCMTASPSLVTICG